MIVSGAAALLLGVVSARAAPSIAWFTGNDAPAWSPNGSLIAFTAFRGGHAGEIYVMRPDGTHQRNLTRNPGYDDLAAWSPDGTKIAFTSNRNGNDEIYVMDADGTRQTRLTHSPRADYSPSWSPDGSRIVFWSNRDANNEIYVMNADGSDQTRLTNDPASDYSPSWGPDGTILFVSSRLGPGRTALYLMNPDGSDQRRLTPPEVDWNEARPVWSPDGTKIAFVSSRDLPFDNTEVYEMNADGTGETRITRSPKRDDWPTWSPDGKRIAFSHGALLKPEIYRVNVDGSGLRLLSRRGPVLESKFLVAAEPVAGARYTAVLGVVTGTGVRVKGATAVCAARVARTTLRVVARSFSASSAHCAWLVPRSAAGKLIEFTIGATLGSSTVTEKIKTPVH